MVVSSVAIPRARLRHQLVFLLRHFLPYYLIGIFRQRRWPSALFARLGWLPFDPTFCQHLRRTYRSDLIRVDMPMRGTLLVFDADSIGRILSRSPAIYAEPSNKAAGMGSFQPEALTISHGTSWRKRRGLNEQVLETGCSAHTLGSAFLIQAPTCLPGDLGDTGLGWTELSLCCRRLAAEVVFGTRDTETLAAVDRLLRLMNRANRLFLLGPTPQQARLEAFIRARASQPPPNSLLARLPREPLDPALKPQRQVPHWLFAIAETLPVNLLRTLLLIAAHPDVERRVLAEQVNIELTDAQAVSELELLEGCIQESMRLWPTTPVIARRMLRRDRLGGAEVAPGTQVLILNNALHRDSRLTPDADWFRPDRWRPGWPGGVPEWVFNHLSNGSQRCAGADLALLLGKGLLASLLRRWSMRALRPLPSSGSGPGKPVPLVNDPFSIRFALAPRSGR